MFFWSNAFLFLKNDYLALNSDVFTHMWSLAVEEQFYLLLPAIFVVVRLAKKIFKIKEKTAFLNVFWLLIFLSLISNILLTNFSESLGIPVHLIPERFAFFATPTRIWEILIGAVASLFSYPIEQKSRPIKTLTISSLVVVTCSAVFLDGWMKFPGINAIPVVLSTLFLVVYGNQNFICFKDFEFAATHMDGRNVIQPLLSPLAHSCYFEISIRWQFNHSVCRNVDFFSSSERIARKS